ncbi:hypothetical protein PG991_003467 [Apiospora marii]|uniref:Uncharacterized protein n=1 Tax=Apiospora marii TaxID=335849 RepID=A0ABR1S3N2_9PEZI
MTQRVAPPFGDYTSNGTEESRDQQRAISCIESNLRDADNPRHRREGNGFIRVKYESPGNADGNFADMNWVKDNDGISDTDLRHVFKYEKKETMAITWSKDDTEPMVYTLDDYQWDTWLQNQTTEQPSSGPRVIIVLARPDRQSTFNSIGEGSATTNTSEGQRYLQTVPFSLTTFQRITDSLYVHGSISNVISRADVPHFSDAQVLMNGVPAYVFNCRSSNAWENDLALTVTHLPEFQKTFCIMFGCNSRTIRYITDRLYALGPEIAYPLLMPAIMVELERLRHISITGQAIASMKARIAELDFNRGDMDVGMGSTAGVQSSARRNTWLDSSHLQEDLINWNFQLEKLKHCVLTYEKANETNRVTSPEAMLLPDRADDTTPYLRTGAKILDRIEAIQEEYAQNIRDCKMRLERMSIATQWAQGETNMTIAMATSYDSMHMRLIAVITIVFLPGTFLAGVMSMTFFNWQPSDGSLVSHYFWIYIGDARHRCYPVLPSGTSAEPEGGLRAPPGRKIGAGWKEDTLIVLEALPPFIETYTIIQPPLICKAEQHLIHANANGIVQVV